MKKSKSLRILVFNLLKNRPASLTLKQIAKDTNLSEPWVKSFHWRGDKSSASVDKVQVLYEYLSGKSLL